MDYAKLDEVRDQIRGTHLRADRPASSARGLHHVALLSSDVERTIRFYQDLLEFPLTEIFENRDYRGSNHFFFDIGNGNLLAFFDFPVLDLGPYSGCVGTPCRPATRSTATPTATGGPPTQYRGRNWSPRAGCCPAWSTRTPTPAPRNPASRWTRTCSATTSVPTWRPGSRCST